MAVLMKLRNLFKIRRSALLPHVVSAPTEIVIEGTPPLCIAEYFKSANGYPIVDWEAVQLWLNEIPSSDLQIKVWTKLEQAWLLRFKETLGAGFQLNESANAMLLSSLDTVTVKTTLESMERILGRILKILDGIAQLPPLGKDILIVFDDEESYYRYISHYHQDDEEYSFSSGMHIDSGCSHHVTIKDDLSSIESVIAHEMVHGCVSHLPLPVWLNEGLAVNMERRVTRHFLPDIPPNEWCARHAAFWQEQTIQEFWSGKSFSRADEGAELSYSLAKTIVEHTAKDWERFKQFVLAANAADAGSVAAKQHLGIDLGEVVLAFLHKASSISWSPDSNSWEISSSSQSDGATENA